MTTASPPLVVDTHAHFDDERLKSDLDGVLARARLAGVVQVVAIGTGAVDSRSILEIARSRPGIRCAVGVHPNDVIDATEEDWTTIVEVSADPMVVALGETGLDRHWNKTPFDDQRAWFDRHLRLAAERSLPVVIHSRDCLADILEQLEALGRPVSGVQHSFTGTPEEAERLVALGLHISFAGMLTFANKSLDPLREAARRVPLDRVLVETDSPYLSPEPFRGKLNEPARVVHTAARLAEIRGLALEELAEATTRNARRLFGLPDDESI